MKRREFLLAAIGILGILAVLWVRSARFQFRDETVIANGCRVPIRILEPEPPDRNLSVIIFHGLTANRRIMQLVGFFAGAGARVFLVDLPGHGDNKDSFTFQRAEECAAALVGALEKQNRVRLDRTLLVGHSMGASIAIRLADRFSTAGTISISSAMTMPTRDKPSRLESLDLPRRMPVNLLLFQAEYDLPAAKTASQRILRAAGGERHSPEDFRQKRAVWLRAAPNATHTSVLLAPEVFHSSLWWFDSVFQMEMEKTLPADILWGLTFVALLASAPLLLFPALATLTERALRLGAAEKSPASPGMLRLIPAWAVTSVVAVVLQYRFVPLGPVVQMYGGDYLASVLVVAGVVLLMSRNKWGQQAVSPQLRWSLREVLAGALLGLATILAYGAWLDWQITDAWLNGPRWWRFAVLAPLMVPYCLAEEMALGSPTLGDPRWWQRLRDQARRYTCFLLLRGALWLAMVFGVAVLRSGEVLILLLAVYLAAFSIAQRLGMDAVRRRTGSAAAAAVFGAILAAWFIAAVFPIT